MAIELFGSNAFPYHIEEFAVVFRCTHLTVAACVDVSDVQNGDGAFDVVHDFQHLFEAAPQLLSPRCFDTDLGGRPFFDPREHRKFVLIVVPDGVDAVDDAGKHVGHLLVGRLSPSKISVVAGVKRDVAGVDGACRLERGLNFCQGTTSLHLSSQEFRIVRTVDVHLEIGFVGQNTGLPVLFKVLGGDHAHGLHLHGFKAQRDDVVHSLDDGASLA